LQCIDLLVLTMEGTRINLSGTEEGNHAMNQIKETFSGTEEGSNHARNQERNLLMK